MTTRQDYYGYIPPSQTLDLGKLATDLSKTISGIGERRELEKEQLDQIKTDNIKTIQEMDLGKSQTFQKMALNGTQGAVDLINTWNKDLKAGILSPKDYKEKMNSIKENWGTFANTVKNYDARMAEIQKQQADGTASGMAVDLNEFFAQSAELKDKQIFWDPSTGSMSLGKVDPNTGQLDPQSVMSARSMSMPNNILFNKVNLNEEVGAIVKEWAPFLKEEGINTINDVRKNDDYSAKLTDLVGALTDNPRMAASILRDNTGGKYSAYVNQADYNSKMNSMINKENATREFQGKEPMTSEEQAEFAKEASNRLIEMRLDSTDTYQPVLTPAQMKAAQDAVVRTAGIYLESKSTQDEPVRSSGGGGGGSTTKPKDTSSQTVDNIRKLIINKDYDALSEFSKDMQYSFKQGAPGKLKVFKKGTNGRTEEIGEVDFDNAGKYFGFENLDKWADYLEDSRKRIPGTGGATKTKFNG
jgi:hypothetical protein